MEINWIHVGAALVGGGAMGAIITAIVSAYRSKVQPVGRRTELLPIFRASGGDSSLRAEISITHEGRTRAFKNLFLLEIQVVNRGNQDLKQFEFGATLSDGDQCIFVEPSPPDRHHTASQVSEPTPHAPAQELDFTLEPFNRRDSYTFKVYLVIPEEHSEPGQITLGSPSPIRFVDIPTMRELVAAYVSGDAFTIGPLNVRLKR